jgi:RNA recognition motif-containing protein
MNIYVGNLNYRSSEESLRKLFEQFGTVDSVKLIKDKDTGKKKGFAFVDMDDEAGQKAIEGLNEKEFDGRNLRVNEARSRDTNTGGGRGGRY